MVLALYQTPLEPGQPITRPYSPRQMEIIAKRLRDELTLLVIPAVLALFVENLGLQLISGA